MEHFAHFWSGVVSFVTATVAFLFDIPAAAVIMAIGGAYGGVFFNPERTTKLISVGLVIAGTFIGAWAVLLAIHNPQITSLQSGDYLAKPIAGLAAFIVVRYHKQIGKAITNFLSKAGG